MLAILMMFVAQADEPFMVPTFAMSDEVQTKDISGDNMLRVVSILDRRVADMERRLAKVEALLKVRTEQVETLTAENAKLKQQVSSKPAEPPSKRNGWFTCDLQGQRYYGYYRDDVEVHQFKPSDMADWHVDANDKTLMRSKSTKMTVSPIATVNANTGNPDALNAKAVRVVFVTASWCGPCQRMKATTLVDPRVTGVLARTQYEVAGEGSYGVTTYPTMIIYSNGVEVQRIVGYTDADSLLAVLRRYVYNENTSSLPPSETVYVYHRQEGLPWRNRR